MNVIIKIDEHEICGDNDDDDENYRPNFMAPSELRIQKEQMTNSVRNFVNTYGIAVRQKAPLV